MAFEYELNKMQEFIISKLKDSGEFKYIKKGHKFSDPILDKQKKRDIFAVKKNGLDNYSRYLIIANVQPFPKQEEFEKKIREASIQGIVSCPVLYKGAGLFKYDNAHNKLSRKHYSMEEKKRQIRTTLLEKFLNSCFGGVFYFKPSSNKLQRIRFKETLYSNYSHRPDIYYDIDYTRVMDHEVLGESDDFTLRCRKSNVLMGIPCHSKDEKFIKMFRTEREADKKDDIGERIAMMLDSCSEEDLKRLTIKFGKEKLGGYAVE